MTYSFGASRVGLRKQSRRGGFLRTESPDGDVSVFEGGPWNRSLSKLEVPCEGYKPTSPGARTWRGEMFDRG